MNKPIEILLHYNYTGEISVASIAFEKNVFMISETEKIKTTPERIYYKVKSDDKEFIINFDLKKLIWFVENA